MFITYYLLHENMKANLFTALDKVFPVWASEQNPIIKASGSNSKAAEEKDVAMGHVIAPTEGRWDHTDIIW